jgi:hypothetical protein
MYQVTFSETVYSGQRQRVITLPLWSGITSDRSTGNIKFRYKLPGNFSWNEIDSTHRHVEPLCYPLLFPHGERGWSKDLPDCDFMSYLANRLNMPEDDLMAANQDGVLIHVNRFQLFARLSQYYAVESVSRAIDYRLQWHRKNQSYIFGEEPRNLNEDNDDVADRDETGNTSDRQVFDNSNATFLSGKFMSQRPLLVIDE